MIYKLITFVLLFALLSVATIILLAMQAVAYSGNLLDNFIALFSNPFKPKGRHRLGMVIV